MAEKLSESKPFLATKSQGSPLNRTRNKASGFFNICVQSRFGGFFVFGFVFLVASFFLRLAFHLRSLPDVNLNIWQVVHVYGLGLIFDLVTCCYIVTPLILIQMFIPDRFYGSKLNRRISLFLYFATLFLVLFDVAAEWLFWDEFGARFNFIAVDYLVYTQEVTGNIWQSYPVPLIIGGILVLTAIIFLLTRKTYLKSFEAISRFPQRLKTGIAFMGIALLSLGFFNISWSNISPNHYANELAKNGFYSLWAAFRNNHIDYKQFYLCGKEQEVFGHVKKQLAADDSRFVSQDPYELTRVVTHAGPEKQYNVVVVVVESLSARFMKNFGSSKELTPRLDALANESMFFTNFYATGTRTTRGLEAVMLSLPPTPGRSLVKRPDNDHLFSLGTIFSKRNYDLKFIYGGRGFFDNMNHFFQGNHFSVVDQSDFAKSEITFTTAWGVCDEDLFNKTIQQCDLSHANKQPFLSVLMTTSNHRPYTYPQKIDIPSGSGRSGAVKYCDYAIGEFIRQAQQKPWFDNTVFVIVADHCASSAGKVDVPIEKYHIPLLIYAPKLILPRRIDTLASQIDLAPTLLGLLNFSYTSRFYGRDVLQSGTARAFLGNYQKVGLLRGNEFCLLTPDRKSCLYHIGPDGSQTQSNVNNPELLADTISYYQTAAYEIDNHLFSDSGL